MKLLIGGSPCTHWSIAQTKHRETTAEGIGWELLKNYLIAREKYKPDYFLYENNKSMASAIREQITKELGVEPVLINSALVSAQNRQRLYWVGKREPDGTYSRVHIEQPEDRGILLRDILETGVCWREKGYTLKAATGAGPSSVIKTITDPGKFPYNGAAEPVTIKPLTEKEMDYMVRETKDGRNHFDFDYFHDATKDKSACVTANTHKGVPYNVLAEPVRIGTIENEAQNQDFDSQQYRVYSPDAKSVTLCGNGGGPGAKTGLYATPVRVGDMPNAEGVIRGGQAHRIYYSDGKAVTLTARPNGGGVDGPLYAVPAPAAMRQVGRRINKQGHRDDYNENLEHIQRFEVNEDPQKTGCLTTVEKDNMVAIPVDWCEYSLEMPDGKRYPVYEARDGQITIKGKQYPIKLADGFYIIRKLTVTECKRLQTVPDEFMFPVSDSQAYKMLGNGWTVDVIAHIMSHFEGLTAEPVEVLSMYDGMSCGHLALNKLGAEVSAHYAAEIDKYAIQTTQHNFPDTVQIGDAFQVREDDWTGGGLIAAEHEDDT